jgi:hypothetical protein
MARQRPGRRRYELDDRLVWDPDAVFEQASPQKPRSQNLLLGKRVETVNENVRVNERGHGRRDPPVASPVP